MLHDLGARFRRFLTWAADVLLCIHDCLSSQKPQLSHMEQLILLLAEIFSHSSLFPPVSLPTTCIIHATSRAIFDHHQKSYTIGREKENKKKEMSEDTRVTRSLHLPWTQEKWSEIEKKTTGITWTRSRCSFSPSLSQWSATTRRMLPNESWLKGRGVVLLLSPSSGMQVLAGCS